ncbi:uncharacterized protein LOC117104331 [Anneissia japonica]|uniref:uncharacterized protein LOC117104331 n=1 Tax=Anneissia japonica TaxID=1529436 RepID=UPI001425AAA3|nr:uncharacterized protein LOC117104331 [Anneissia japonica]
MSTKKLAKFVMSRLGLPSSDETETATPASSLKKRLDDSNLSSSVGLGPVIDHKDGDADGETDPLPGHQGKTSRHHKETSRPLKLDMPNSRSRRRLPEESEFASTSSEKFILPDWCFSDSTKVTTEIIIEISALIGNRVTTIGGLLGFSKNEIEKIELDHKSDFRSQAYELLHMWMERNGVHATKKILAQVLVKIERAEAAARLWPEQKLYPESPEVPKRYHTCQLYNVSLSVVYDDIFYQNTDAIVVTTFDRDFGIVGFGLGIGALQNAGDQARNEFSDKLAILRSSRQDNNVITTDGGDLKCKYIFHIGIPGIDDNNKWQSILTQNVIHSLQRCEKPLNCVSITIPLLYSSFWHFGLGKSATIAQICADIIVSTVLDYLEHMSSRSSIKEVIFIDMIKQKALRFQQALQTGVKERKVRAYQMPTRLMCEYIYPDTKARLIVASGDPKKQPADILVNPSANFTVAYSGLTAKILIEAALPTDVIQKAFESHKGHQLNLVITSAGKLPFQHLYHVRGNDDEATDYTQQSLQIETCTIDCLMTAEKAGLKSIVLPLIYNRYTEIGQRQCALIMLDAIHRFMNKFKRESIEEVYFYTRYPSNALKLKEELIIRYGDRVVDVKGGQVPIEVLARGLEANNAFIDAIQEGSKPIYQTRLMLVGPERVGKTSLTKALTEQEFDATEEVTDGIEASLSCTLSVKHTTNWKPQPKPPEGTISEARQQYLRAVAEQIAVKLLQKKHEKPESRPSMKIEIQTLESVKVPVVTQSTKTSPDTLVQSHDQRTASEDVPASDDEVDAPKRSSSQDDSASPTTPDVPEEVVQIVLQILQDKERRGENEGLEETLDDLTLSIWDFAGQDLYYITHQVFLVSRALYIICFNLCNDLHAPAKVQIYKREDGKVSFFEHHMSNLEFIIFWLRSIYSNTTENPSVANQEQFSPPVFIAGTHRESLPGNAEERQALAEEKFAVIKKALRGTPYEGHVVSKYYAIDNSLRSPLDQAVIHLRDHITEVAKLEHYMGERIPIKWLDFLHEVEQLRNKQTHSINFTEASSSRLFASFDIWLICIFRRVITVKDPSEQWAKFRSSWARLDEEGLLEERLIRHMWHDFLAQLEGLLQLMQKFDLLCVKAQSSEMPAVVGSHEEGNRLFYVPSLLKKQEDEMVCMDPLIKSKSVVILYIDFNGFLPEGLFYRLILRLVQWSQHQGGYEPRLFYQQANLYVDEDHDMILRILPQKRSCIQVAIVRAKSVGSDDEEEEEDDVEPCPDVCKVVLALLENNLLNLGHTWMKRIDFGLCILCSACDREKNHFHELKKCLKAKSVPCGNHRRMKTKRFQRLFGESGAMQETPKSPAAQVKHKVPVFLRSLSGVFKEISSPILPFDLMTEICVLLDPLHPLSNDWRGLASKLGYDRYINYLSMKLSPTMCILNGWSEKGWSVEDLKECMMAMKRHDVVRLIDKQLPTEG